ncbi:MAG: response regulator transcription factor, partial [Clostridia bacterium]|nr:response regulator transcription factor [Clostridia bacterium]
MRILVVDDEKLLVKGITFNLENDGYEVDGAYDGQQALELFQKNTYDLIILDLMLPIYDGLSLCRKIRETSEVPIIMLTAKGEISDKILGLEYGADDYMTKPFDILELKTRIKTILRRSTRAAQSETKVESVLTAKDLRVDL